MDPKAPAAPRTPLAAADTESCLSGAVERGAVALIRNTAGELLLHLRDDIEGIAWPGYWSVLGGGCDPGESAAEAISRELAEEAGLSIAELEPLFSTVDVHGSGQEITFFAGHWDGDEQSLPLTEGVKLQFFVPDRVDVLTMPPFIRDGIHRYLTTRRC